MVGWRHRASERRTPTGTQRRPAAFASHTHVIQGTHSRLWQLGGFSPPESDLRSSFKCISGPTCKHGKRALGARGARPTWVRCLERGRTPVRAAVEHRSLSLQVPRRAVTETSGQLGQVYPGIWQSARRSSAPIHGAHRPAKALCAVSSSTVFFTTSCIMFPCRAFFAGKR